MKNLFTIMLALGLSMGVATSSFADGKDTKDAKACKKDGKSCKKGKGCCKGAKSEKPASTPAQ